MLYLILTSAYWWRDVIRESTFQGCHTSVVQKGLKLGMIYLLFLKLCSFFHFFGLFFILVYHLQ
jgi:cytochrome c oxidase subunit 3